MTTTNDDIQRIGTDDPRMSKITIHNNIVYLSGQVDDVATDISGQTKNTLAKIDQILEEAGTNKSRILKAQIWLKDIDQDFKAMNEVWKAWVDPKNKPCRACVESKMALPTLLVEIQVEAALK